MPTTNLDNLEKFVSRMNQEVPTMKDFEDAIQKILDLVQAILARHEKGIKELQETHEKLMGNVRDETSFSLSDIKGQVNDVFVGDQIKRIDGESKMSHEEMKKIMLEMIEKKIGEMDSHMKNNRFHKEEMTKGMMDMRKEITMKKPDTAKQIAEKLNAEKEIIDLDVIKGLKEVMKLLNQKMDTKMSFGGGGARRGRLKIYDLSDLLDNSTKVFNIPANWAVFGVFSGGSVPTVFRPTIDYTSTSTQITFTSQIEASTTLAVGQTILVQYEEI